MSKISDYIEKRSKKDPDFREAIQQDMDELINQLPTGDWKDSVDDEAGREDQYDLVSDEQVRGKYKATADVELDPDDGWE